MNESNTKVWYEENLKLMDEMQKWEKIWVHNNPCPYWKAYQQAHGVGFCDHLLRARTRKFGPKIKEIDTLLLL
jgi:hypothetical protein